MAVRGKSVEKEFIVKVYEGNDPVLGHYDILLCMGAVL